MTDEARLEATVRKNEDYKPRPYKDTRALWTFGNGRCLETHPLSAAEWKLLLDRGYLEVTINPAGADLLEQLELAVIETALAHDYADFWPRLNDARQNALAEMAYQMSVAKEESFHGMLAAIRVAVASDRPEDWAIVEQKGLASDWAQQTPARAQRVMHQLRTGEF